MTTKFEHELKLHKMVLKAVLYYLANQLKERADIHDNSKYDQIEKKLFEEISQIDRKDFDSYEQWFSCTKPLLEPALKHHYENNRHHPEHFEKGVNEMNLLDILEMIVDWNTSASCRGTELDIEYCFKRFKIDKQLQQIIKNTLPLLEGEIDNATIK